VFADALYFKSPEQILLMDDITPEKIVRAICLYLVYGYADLAHTLSTSARNQGLLRAETYDTVGSIMSKIRDQNPLPNFKGKGRIKDILQKIANLFSDTGWYSGTDNSVGTP
jgi:hypothetical protein